MMLLTRWAPSVDARAFSLHRPVLPVCAPASGILILVRSLLACEPQERIPGTSFDKGWPESLAPQPAQASWPSRMSGYFPGAKSICPIRLKTLPPPENNVREISTCWRVALTLPVPGLGGVHGAPNREPCLRGALGYPPGFWRSSGEPAPVTLALSPPYPSTLL